MIDFNNILKEEQETISLLKDGIAAIKREIEKGDNAYEKWKLRYEKHTIERDLKVKEVILERTKAEIESQTKKKIITPEKQPIKIVKP